MTRIAIVSNRLPSLDRDEASAGGLAVGLSASLEDAGGTWLGWDGTVASAPDGAAHIQQSAPYNRDGSDANYSANCGRAGPTADRTVEDVKIHQTKNMLATLFLSRRVPMLLGGDEFRRTQNGNNNAYCQDNAVSWYDWRLLDANREVFRFVRELIAFRKRNPVLSADAFYTDSDLHWFAPSGRPPDWHGPTHLLGCIVRP